jgi:hypothetical protein
MRNGLIDGTKCQSEERKRNFFLLLFIANITEGSRKLKKALGYGTTKWNKCLDFLKLYLAIEEWFHDCNGKDEVNNARPLIVHVLKLVQELIQREEGTHGYCIPKMHGMSIFQSYIKRYDSAMNYFGGPGKAAHKFSMKAPGQKTQRGVGEFDVQTANQYYDVMVTRHALKALEQEQNILHDNCAVKLNEAASNLSSDEDEEVPVEFSGKYSLLVTNNLLQLMRDGKDLHVSWKSDKEKMKENNENYCLDRDLVKVILKKLDQLNINDYSQGYLNEGYT